MCGLFFNPDKEFLIDKTAFAVNDRCYNPSVADNYYKSNKSDRELILANVYKGIFNFHENRCVGKAMYGLILDNNPYDPDVISGFNSKSKRPLELLLKCD